MTAETIAPAAPAVPIAVEPIDYIDVVMSVPPGPHSEFIETEDDGGSSIGTNRGLHWIAEDDGTHRLRIPAGAFGRQLVRKTLEHDLVEYTEWHDLSHTTTGELHDIEAALEDIDGPLSDFLMHAIETFRHTASPQRLIVLDREELLEVALGSIPDEVFT